jgi:hypothetical protein
MRSLGARRVLGLERGSIEGRVFADPPLTKGGGFNHSNTRFQCNRALDQGLDGFCSPRAIGSCIDRTSQVMIRYSNRWECWGAFGESKQISRQEERHILIIASLSVLLLRHLIYTLYHAIAPSN